MSQQYEPSGEPTDAPPPFAGSQYMPPAYAPSYGAPPAVPGGFYFDPASNLNLPNGTQLASIGRRIGAYFLSAVLLIVTLGIGWVIWGALLWGRGTSPAYSLLGMRVYKPAQARPANFGEMALRDIVGYIAQSLLSLVSLLTSFILMCARGDRRNLPDLIASTVVLYDPNKVLG